MTRRGGKRDDRKRGNREERLKGREIKGKRD
jgi:hypothetical protein